MTRFTLYGSAGSSNTDRVRLTLAEGGFTDYEHILLNLRAGEQKSQAHLARHPWGKVPAVTFQDGFTFYESRAICKYLTRKYNLPFLPSSSDLEATALFDQAESVEMLYFADPAGKIGFEKFAKKMMGLPANEDVVTEAIKSLKSYLDVAEQLLQQSDYMAGKNFTLVDIFYIPLVQRLFACGYGDLLTSRGHVNAWWERCISRPAIQKMINADREAMVAVKAQ